MGSLVIHVGNAHIDPTTKVLNSMLRFRSLATLAGIFLMALVAFAPMASAQTDDPAYPIVTTPPTVLGTDFKKADPPADPPAQVLSAAVSRQTLPVTGSDVLGLSVLGLVAIGAGVALVRYQRSAAVRV